jgi:type IV secretory pathway VirB10-like protein
MTEEKKVSNWSNSAVVFVSFSCASLIVHTFAKQKEAIKDLDKLNAELEKDKKKKDKEAKKAAEKEAGGKESAFSPRAFLGKVIPGDKSTPEEAERKKIEKEEKKAKKKAEKEKKEAEKAQNGEPEEKKSVFARMREYDLRCLGDVSRGFAFLSRLLPGGKKEKRSVQNKFIARARALFDYQAMEGNELSFNKGDIINVMLKVISPFVYKPNPLSL